jgi:hypothetical protein
MDPVASSILSLRLPGARRQNRKSLPITTWAPTQRGVMLGIGDCDVAALILGS